MTANYSSMEEYYRHFKGNVYRILHIAKDSETLEEMVVYQAMYGERGVWVRPKTMFNEVVERDGKSKSKAYALFNYISPCDFFRHFDFK